MALPRVGTVQYYSTVLLLFWHWSRLSTVSSVENTGPVGRGIRGRASPAGQLQNVFDVDAVGQQQQQADDDGNINNINSSEIPIPVASTTVPLHAHAGTHHVYLYIGSPVPQRQTLILDTGSRYMAFPCEPFCKQCGKHDSKKFNGTKSTTILANAYPNCIFAKPNKDLKRQDNSCIFHQKYLEGSSWTAKEMEDIMWLASADEEESIEAYMAHLAIPFVFGCQTSVTGHFVGQYADGILGMARALNESAFLNTMVQAGAIQQVAFATCLTRQGGSLSLGGSGLATTSRQLNSNNSPNNEDHHQQQQYHIEPMQFAKQKENLKGLYALDIATVFVGDICITCGESPNRKMAKSFFQTGRGAVLDTGTTDTFFPKNVLPALKAAWTSLAGFNMQESRQYSYEEFQMVPDITMVFEPNATLVIPATSYMENLPFLVDALEYANATTSRTVPDTVEPWEGTRRLIMRIYCEEKSGAVLGANSLYHYDVLYDLEPNRIGLARSHCGA